MISYLKRKFDVGED